MTGRNESPIFIAEFADGEVTRMTVCTSLGRLDVERGVRLARCAHYSRKREQPPPIVAARFEQDGQLLESYSAVDLEDIEDNRPIEDFDAKTLLVERRQAEQEQVSADDFDAAARDAEASEEPL